MVWPLGTLINILAVLLGGSIGLAVGGHLSEAVSSILFQGVGLAVLLMGIQLALKALHRDFLLLMFSLIAGGVLGQLLELDIQAARWAELARRALGFHSPQFAEGLVAAFTLFCVGSISIVGSIEEGLRGDRRLLQFKSMIDGLVAIALASTLGVGVLFSVLPMLVFQGGITLLAGGARRLLSDDALLMLSGTGGVLITAIGLNLVVGSELRVMNFMPALLLVVIVTRAKERLVPSAQ